MEVVRFGLKQKLRHFGKGLLFVTAGGFWDPKKNSLPFALCPSLLLVWLTGRKNTHEKSEKGRGVAAGRETVEKGGGEWVRGRESRERARKGR